MDHMIHLIIATVEDMNILVFTICHAPVQPDVILVRKRQPVVPVVRQRLLVPHINGAARMHLFSVVMDNIVELRFCGAIHRVQQPDVDDYKKEQNKKKDDCKNRPFLIA